MKYIWSIERHARWRWRYDADCQTHREDLGEEFYVQRFRLIERKDGIRYMMSVSGNNYFDRLADAYAHIRRWIESPRGEECLIWRCCRADTAPRDGEIHLGKWERTRPTIAEFDAALADAQLCAHGQPWANTCPRCLTQARIEE